MLVAIHNPKLIPTPPGPSESLESWTIMYLDDPSMMNSTLPGPGSLNPRIDFEAPSSSSPIISTLLQDIAPFALSLVPLFISKTFLNSLVVAELPIPRHCLAQTLSITPPAFIVCAGPTLSWKHRNRRRINHPSFVASTPRRTFDRLPVSSVILYISIRQRGQQNIHSSITIVRPGCRTRLPG
jgi:hypothetical protein